MLVVTRGVLEATFVSMRTCGDGRLECVALWTGPLDRPGEADAVVLPPHHATRTGYTIEPAWITGFYAELRRSRRTTRAQVHTHPGASVADSATDDNFPLVVLAGFVSIVLPWFATREISLDRAGIYEYTTKGWACRLAGEVITWS